MSDISSVTEELADVDEQLRALPDDAFADKYELLKKQDVLRERAAQFAVDADKERSTEVLLSELSGLRSQLAQLDSQKIDLVVQAGSGGMSNMGNLGGVALNAQMHEASGASRIQARIGVVKGVLIDRGVEVPEAQ
jgi:predicted naringenin-chalcone synthase